MEILLCHFDLASYLFCIRGRISQVKVPLAIFEVHGERKLHILVISYLKLVYRPEFLHHFVPILVYSIREIHKDFLAARISNFLDISQVPVHLYKVELVII